MKLLAPLALILAGCFVASDVDRKDPEQSYFSTGGKKDGDKKKPQFPFEKWNFGPAEKIWGLKVKSMEFDPPQTGFQNITPYTFLIEFTRDLQPEELTKLKEAFPTNNNIKTTRSKKFELYHLDSDNVVVEKQTYFFVNSELTGVKGDRFRLLAHGGSYPEKKAVKVELRIIK